MSELSFKFNSVKAVQALGILMRHGAGSDVEKPNKYTRLLKILYIADKENLKEIGEPITGDQVVAMENGPVLSKLLDLIKGKLAAYPYCKRHIERDNHEIRLKKDPGASKLSPCEKQKLEQVAKRYKNHDMGDMIDLTHEFEEWEENYIEGTSNPITIEEILKGEDALESSDVVKVKASVSELLTR